VDRVRAHIALVVAVFAALVAILVVNLDRA